MKMSGSFFLHEKAYFEVYTYLKKRELISFTLYWYTWLKCFLFAWEIFADLQWQRGFSMPKSKH
jgi:hypothetical protein